MTTLALLLAILCAAPAQAKKHPKARPAAQAPADPAAALAARVQSFYKSAKDFSADFAQRYTYKAFGRTDESKGKVQVKKPGLVRWDYAQPEPKSMIVEGRALTIWQPEDNEVTKVPDFGGDQLSAAFTFLWGRGDLLKEFSAALARRPDGLPEGEALELKPRKTGGSVESLLFVVAKTGEVLAARIVNPQGDTNELVFSNAKVDAGLADSIFHFVTPKGAYEKTQNAKGTP